MLDAGALIAYERGDRVVQAFLERANRQGEPVRTTTTVVAQVFRRPSAQAKLARLLRGVIEITLDSERARRTGILLQRATRADVVDASLVEALHDGDEVLTGDVDDIVRLATAAGKTVIVTRV
jgi:hypothetical protein